MLYKVGARSNAGLLFTHAFSVAIRYFRVSLAYIQTAAKDFSNVNCLRLVKYVSIELFTSYCTEEISLSIDPIYLQEFGKKSNSLYTILRSSRLAGSQRAPFLRRFLLRLNFNSFFEVTIQYFSRFCFSTIQSLIISLLTGNC